MSDDLVQKLRLILASAVNEPDLPELLRNLIRSALVELAAWEASSSERALKLAILAEREWQNWRAEGQRTESVSGE